MMSSEEDSECFGLYGDKLLKKAKRTRQRVDAGEPRNSYSSIPNFSSRPSFLSGGLYGAIFSQSQQHFGLFAPGFGPGKMLNELLGRQAKQAADAAAAAAPPDAIVAMDAAADCRRGLDDESTSPPTDLAHHLLRDILQGRKKDLLTLEQELRAVSVSGNASPDNNNSINNNNNELKNGGLVSSSGDGCSSDTENGKTMNNGDMDAENASGEEDGPIAAGDESMSEVSGLVVKQQPPDMEERSNCAASDSEPSLASPAGSPATLLQPKSEPEPEAAATPGASDGKEDGSNAVNAPHKPEVELKRARVENIVSSMRSSPSLPTQVNGCKKRKLYHPQQHGADERYSGASTAVFGLGMLMDDDEDLEPVELRQKRVEKNALKSQLRTMQEQLAEMQQKYVQLCTRMEQESDCQDGDDVASDIDQDVNSQPPLEKPAPPTPPTPAAAPLTPAPAPQLPKEVPPPPSAIAKLSNTVKMQQHGHSTHGGPGQHPMLLNGGLGGMLASQGGGHDGHAPPPPAPPPPHHAQHPHPHHHAISNAAAAMYLGVSHKLFMEQEARLKEQAEAQQAQHQAQAAAAQHQAQLAKNSSQQQQQQQQQSQQAQASAPHQPEFPERFAMFRSQTGGQPQPIAGSDLDGLADVLKSEITASLNNLIDSIVTRFLHQRRFLGKQSEAAAVAAEQLNKDLLMASQLLDRKSPRTKVIDRGQQQGPRVNGSAFPNMSMHGGGVGGATGTGSSNSGNNPGSGVAGPQTPGGANNAESNMNSMNLQHVRPTSNIFNTPKSHSAAAAAALYSMAGSQSHMAPFCLPDSRGDNPGSTTTQGPEQNEALSLVVAPKKKRHKVTDTRITPRTVSRILAQDGLGPQTPNMENKYNNNNSQVANGQPSSGLMASTSGAPITNGDSPPPPPPPPPRPYHPPPPPMLPVSLPTSVAIPNPSLHESQVFSPYSPFFGAAAAHHPAQHQHAIASSSPPGLGSDPRDSPPLPHPPTLLHPALLAAAQHGGSPDYGHLRAAADSQDRNSDCNSGDGPYDGIQPTSSTLTPMHLRKAKLMFFWVRYPSSAVLKMYFPDIKFNKNNTAQLVKWFSNFREFYYIQMEKYARQAVSEGIKNAEDLHVGADSEIYRVLNLHYNRNNHIEVWGPQVPSNFRFVVEQTLREFFKAIQGGKDTEQSWKKSIYKIISRLDDPVPEYFKSPNFLEQLE